MPMTYRIDREQGMVFTRAWGVLTDDEILSHKEQLARDPEFHPGMPQLSDVREIERLDVTTAGVKALVAHDAANIERVAGHRMALVAGTDEVFGMARMYQLRGEALPTSIGVFRCPDKARAWLMGADQA